METKFNIKQLLVDRVIKTRLLKVIKVPQEPVQEILNSIYKIEIDEIFIKGTNLGIDSKVSLHIIYIPQGIGEFKQTFSVSFNFSQELPMEGEGEPVWPQVRANIEKLVIKPQGKNLQILLYIVTEVLVMGLKEYRILDKGNSGNINLENMNSENINLENIDSVMNTKDRNLPNIVPLVIDNVNFVEDFTIHKVLELPQTDNNPWQLAEVYSEGINYNYAYKEAGLEIKIMILARVIGYKKSSPTLQSQYQLIEFSLEKNIEGWESQRGLAIEPQFFQLELGTINDLMALSFKAKFTVLSTMAKLLKVNIKDLGEAAKHLVVEKPIIRQREVVEIVRELVIDPPDLQLRPEVFVRFAKRDSNVLEGMICMKMFLEKYPKDITEGKSIKAIEYIPFKVVSTFVKKPLFRTLVEAKVKIKKIDQLSKKKIKCYLFVSIDLLGSEILTCS